MAEAFSAAEMQGAEQWFRSGGAIVALDRMCTFDERGLVDFEATFAANDITEHSTDLFSGLRPYGDGWEVLILDSQCKAEKQLTRGHELGHLMVLRAAQASGRLREWIAKSGANDRKLEALCELVGFYCMLPRDNWEAV